MGCDIHVHTEVKIKGVWHHWGAPRITRSYLLFAKMAGVRNYEVGHASYVTPIAEPKGLPDDLSFLTRFDYEQRWRLDAHSCSWLSGEEIDQLEAWYIQKKAAEEPKGYFYIEKEFGYLFGNGWNVKKYPHDSPPDVQDARWVFWFDN